MGGDGWRTLPFDHVVLVNPSVRMERGKIYPFVDMQAIDPGSRIVGHSEERPFKGGGSRFMNGDTLMARITPCLENGKIARYVAPKGKDAGHGSTEFIVIRGRPNVTDNGFAYYLTKWDGVRQYCISQMTGSSGRQRVPTSALSHHEVTIPPLKEQQAIACILGALDDKIELNRRMNRTLEEMARAIFKSWFVDFDPVHWNSARRLANIPRSEPGKWFIYAIECEGGSHYIGFTDDLHRRFDEHCRGCGADWTKAHPPVRLAYWEPVDSQAEAVAREQKLKSGSGREWLKAEIARNWTPRRPLPAGRQVKPEIAALFPDTFEPSELGEIPKGWSVGMVGDIAMQAIGGQWGADGPTVGVTPAVCLRGCDMEDLRQHGAAPSAPVRYIKPKAIESRLPCKNDLLIAASGAGPCGRPLWCAPEIAELFDVPVIYSNFVKRFSTPSSGHAIYLDRILIQKFEDRSIGDFINGTSVPNLDAPGLLSGCRILLPPPDVVETFARFCLPMYARLYSKENITLAALRDTLLPKLISGELRVPDAERIAGRCL